MFVIDLAYKAPLDAVDALMEDHRAWLRQGIEDGILLVAGRKAPRTGGVLIAIGPDKAAIEAFARQDPFVLHGVADSVVTEVAVGMAAPGLDIFKQ